MSKQWRSEEYKQFIREQPCLNCGSGESIPHHEGCGKGGVSLKAPDSHCLPLCYNCHFLVHHKGCKTFWQSVDVKMKMIEYLTEFIRRRRDG